VLVPGALRCDIWFMGSEIPTNVEGPKLLARMRRTMRSAHYSERTEAAYLVSWGIGM